MPPSIDRYIGYYEPYATSHRRARRRPRAFRRRRATPRARWSQAVKLMRRGRLAAARCAAARSKTEMTSNRGETMSTLVPDVRARASCRSSLSIRAERGLRRGAGGASATSIWLWIGFGIALFFLVVGMHDLLQKPHAVLRNYPIAGASALHPRGDPAGDAPVLLRGRQGRPAVQPRPARRSSTSAPRTRSTCGRSAPTTTSTSDGYEWMTPFDRAARRSARSRSASPIGGPDCTQPYSASVFNISAMSFGSLSGQRHPRAERRRQARRLRARHRRGRLQPLSSRGRRRHRLGDRLGLLRLPQSRRHLLAREVRRGRAQPQVKMVELKLSQGAKPGHGGVLPAPRSAARSR